MHIITEKEMLFMNRTYKVIWSKARHCYVVVSELAKSHGKTSTKAQTTSGRKIVLASLAAAVLTFGSYGLADAAGWASTENGLYSKANGIASIAVGLGDQVANKGMVQGATAIAAGTLNVIDAAAGVDFDGVANKCHRSGELYQECQCSSHYGGWQQSHQFLSARGRI